MYRNSEIMFSVLKSKYKKENNTTASLLYLKDKSEFYLISFSNHA